MITERVSRDHPPLVEATPGDAVTIAKLLDVERESVWRIIHGMRYSDPSELALAVHRAFLGGVPESGSGTPTEADLLAAVSVRR